MLTFKKLPEETGSGREGIFNVTGGRILTKPGNNLQNISRTLWNGTTDYVFHRDRSCCRCSVSTINTGLVVATKVGWTWINYWMKQTQRSTRPVPQRPSRTYHSNRNRQIISGMSTDQVATTIICSLLFLGILDGTNLITTTSGSSISSMVSLDRRDTNLNSMFFWRAATGCKGVTESLDNRSLRDDDDSDLEAEDSVLPGSILANAPGWY